MQWIERPAANGRGAVMTAKSSRGRWDGDESGREWGCGYAIHDADDDVESLGFDLYSDDGRGNGDFIGTFATLDGAQSAADVHDAEHVALDAFGNPLDGSEPLIGGAR